MQLNASKSGAIRHLGTALAATVIGLSGSAFAQPQPLASVPPHSLVITENSSSSLTVVYDGNPITIVGLASDHWQFTLPDLVHLGSGESSPGGVIPEPEAAGVLGPWNNVFTSTSGQNPFVNLVDVVSDSKTTDPVAQPLTDNVAGLVGFDSNQRAIMLTFHDAGDGSGTVPDRASTGALAIISLISLFVIGRLRLVQTC